MIATRSAIALQVRIGPARPPFMSGAPFMLYGVLLLAAGFGLYTCGILWTFLSFLFNPGGARTWSMALLTYGGVPVLAGIFLIGFELAFQLPRKRADRRVPMDPVRNSQLTVVLTAYNDEQSI